MPRGNLAGDTCGQRLFEPDAATGFLAFSELVPKNPARAYRLHRYPDATYFRQLCASLKPSTSRAFLLESGASNSPSSRVIGTSGQ